MYVYNSAACEPKCSIMAGFAAQAALRSKWGDLVDTGASSLPEPSEAITGLKNVVGWLKQVSLKEFYFWSIISVDSSLSFIVFFKFRLK